MDILDSEMSALVAYTEQAGGVNGGASPRDLRELLRCKQSLYDGVSDRLAPPRSVGAEGEVGTHEDGGVAGGAGDKDTAGAEAAVEAVEVVEVVEDTAARTTAAALRGLLERLQRTVDMQRRRHRHLADSVPVLLGLLNELGPRGAGMTADEGGDGEGARREQVKEVEALGTVPPAQAAQVGVPPPCCLDFASGHHSVSAN